jgi:hypothetical protein
MADCIAWEFPNIVGPDVTLYRLERAARSEANRLS